jgi:predicted DNA-binding transcriptional regulator YafY
VNKTERQFNLIALLLDTRRALRASEIRARFEDYSRQSDEAFKRMFERDKTDVEDLGFAIEREIVDTITEEIGYRIRPDTALLPDLGLTPDEMAALSLAAQAWEPNADSLGLLKLSVVAGAGEPGPAAFVVPRMETDDNVRALFDAISRRKVVRFAYRSGAGALQQRSIEPHWLRHRGTWYLIGFDRDRKEVRHFKLIRVEGKVSVEAGDAPDFAPPERTSDVPRAPWEAEEASTPVRVAFAPDVAWWVQRRTRARRAHERDDGWVVLETTIADVESFAAWLTGFGDSAIAIEPEELRNAVLDRLRVVAERA